MSTIIKRQRAPLRGITRQEFLTPFDRIFDEMVSSMFPSFSSDFGDDFFTKGSYPKVNVINCEKSIEIEASIPGLTKKEIDVSVTEGTLTIQGQSKQRKNVKDSQYVTREIKKSSFRRSFTLGENLNHEKISASFDNGILTLSIPKLVPTEKKIATRKVEIS